MITAIKLVIFLKSSSCWTKIRWTFVATDINYRTFYFLMSAISFNRFFTGILLSSLAFEISSFLPLLMVPFLPNGPYFPLSPLGLNFPFYHFPFSIFHFQRNPETERPSNIGPSDVKIVLSDEKSKLKRYTEKPLWPGVIWGHVWKSWFP